MSCLTVQCQCNCLCYCHSPKLLHYRTFKFSHTVAAAVFIMAYAGSCAQQYVGVQWNSSCARCVLCVVQQLQAIICDHMRLCCHIVRTRPHVQLLSACHTHRHSPVSISGPACMFLSQSNVTVSHAQNRRHTGSFHQSNVNIAVV